MFNATNTRNFGIPEGRINNANFLNQWGTDGGSRARIWGALRFVFYNSLFTASPVAKAGLVLLHLIVARSGSDLVSCTSVLFR